MKAFDNSEFEKHKAEAKEKWGSTDAYKEHAERTKNYSKQKWSDLAVGMDHIMAITVARCNGTLRSNMEIDNDGTPNGYMVMEVDGDKVEWYYKSIGHDRDYQMRLYRGNLKCGGEHEYFELQHGEDVILANVFNADNAWTVKVYENDQDMGTMTRIANAKIDPDAGSSQSNPTKPSVQSSQDWWAIGYHIGVVGRGHVGGTRANYLTNSFHIYKYTLKNKNAAVRVEATDRFGRTYSTSTITGDYDYSLVK